ncbi:MAG: bifunctional 4-hydroxy-2-oxoglutarate aldolase/2-dehydro-3-deoxy-phosphogluconate aldolase [Sediminibacterium sp.]|nr:MAG: bifunctional 4-hydroxy-2-oxoglutarate aldolase/2-dehydro-3-deoxy-phosphogluconate aldolase [Sediminibacterium sp.]
MMTEEQMKAYVKKIKLLPLFYHDEIEVCKEMVKALYVAGIRCIEFTNRGPKALENFKLLLTHRNKNYPDLVLAIGTIQNQKQAEAFIEAGADFLISPFFDQSIADAAYLHKKLWIPGCMTSTEIHIAEVAGCDLIKLFPGNVLGPGFVTAIKPLFPRLSFLVTGGVDTSKENLTAWFNAGVVGVGMGSKLIKEEVLASRNYAVIEAETTKALAIINSL